jgi:murein DD-endopeptidase MepM/ murein hydrolase activator NlpD
MTSPTRVPKPADASAGQNAIITVNGPFVNIRSGPGLNYQDVGDITSNSLVRYYPNTRTNDNWYWVEARGSTGWVLGDVVAFEAVVGDVSGPEQAPTPYDGKTALWHWKGSAVSETTIEELASNIRRNTPNVRMVFVKTSDGPNWQGKFDGGPMAINSANDVRRWVDTLKRYNLEFHAWCVPTGKDPASESAIINAVCQVPGVQSMILDVEPYQEYWRGGAAGVRPYMLKIRQTIGMKFHVGMSVDPRPWHYDAIHPREWYPFINSIHPQVYWATFRTSPEDALMQMLNTWGTYGRTIIPILQGDAALQDQRVAHQLATQRFGMRAVSWWRYGVIPQWPAINLPIELSDTAPDADEDSNDGAVFEDEVLVLPDGDGFRRGTYTGQAEFIAFTGTRGWQALYTGTNALQSDVWAEWKTALPASGRYEISVYIPARHATTTRARYKVHGVRGTNTELIIDLNQSRERNRWVTLGIFDIIKDTPNAGKVFLNDVTGENDKQIAFDAVRFRRIVTLDDAVIDIPTPAPEPQPEPPTPTVWLADGFDAPIGTLEERRSSKTWPGRWGDATGFGAATHPDYLARFNSYHTGVDLNLGWGDQDLGEAVYAPASGIVIYQADLQPWGNVTIIRHDPLLAPQGPIFYSRYGHMQNVLVRLGQRVRRGEKIGEIGTGDGRFIAHLHYDICQTTVLEQKPGDWPGRDLRRLLSNYVDPKRFTRDNRP